MAIDRFNPRGKKGGGYSIVEPYNRYKHTNNTNINTENEPMKKLEINGDIYYKKNGKFFDEHFIEVDVNTRNKIIQQIKNSNTINYKAPQNNITSHCSKNIVIETISKPNNNSNNHSFNIKQNIKEQKYNHSDILELKDSGLKEPELKDFGLKESEIEIYNSAISKFVEDKEKYDSEIKKYNDEKVNVGLASLGRGFLSFLIFEMLVGLIFMLAKKDAGSYPENFVIILFFVGILIGAIIGFIYYKIKVPKEPSEIDINDYILEKLRIKVEKYIKKLKEYEEKIKFAKKKYWNNLDPYTFEEEVANLFIKYGASASVTSKSGDHGVDIKIIYKEKTYAVQCKHYNNPVGPAPLRELRGVLEQEFNEGVFVSLNGYTENAIQENNHSNRKLILLTMEDLIKIDQNESLDKYL